MKCVFFFKQKTAYEMRISDWSSDVCSSDLQVRHAALAKNPQITNVLVTTGVGVVVLETCHRDRSVPAIRLAWIIMDEAGLEHRKCLADRIDARSRSRLLEGGARRVPPPRALSQAVAEIMHRLPRA